MKKFYSSVLSLNSGQFVSLGISLLIHSLLFIMIGLITFFWLDGLEANNFEKSLLLDSVPSEIVLIIFLSSVLLFAIPASILRKLKALSLITTFCGSRLRNFGYLAIMIYTVPVWLFSCLGSFLVDITPEVWKLASQNPEYAPVIAILALTIFGALLAAPVTALPKLFKETFLE